MSAITVTKPYDVPDKAHYAILTFVNIRTTDESSPGIVSYEDSIRYEAYANKTEWEAEIKRLSLLKSYGY